MTKLFLSWCRWIMDARPKFAVHENVKGFDRAFLEELLGDLYHIQHIFMTPRDMGFPSIRRPRWYSILLRRENRGTHYLDLESLYCKIKSALHYHVQGHPGAWVWRASAEQLLEYENEQRRHRGLPDLVVRSESWEYLLSPSQITSLRYYEAHYGLQEHGREPHGREPNGPASAWTFDLAQSPGRSGASAAVLPTLRRNSRRLWSPTRRRWLLPMESYAAMGFPAFADLAVVAGVQACDMNSLGPSYSLGNAMHVANAGCAFLLACLAEAVAR